MAINPTPAHKKAIMFQCAHTPAPIACKHAGFNLLELLLVLSIVGVMASIAYPSYTQYFDKSKNALAVSDIRAIEQAIDRFYTAFERYPDSLVEIGLNGMLDPWENPYQY